MVLLGDDVSLLVVDDGIVLLLWMASKFIVDDVYSLVWMTKMFCCG